MARPRKTDTETMLRLVDDYFESTGDPSKLKCSYLEEYAVSQGIDVKAYDFRRNADVRLRMEKLREISPTYSKSGAIAYKSLDVDAFLFRCRTKKILRDSLLELDETWRRVYERAADMSVKNAELKSAANCLTEQREESLSKIAELSEQAAQFESAAKNAINENRYLKRMLKTYLYPAIANEILLRENVLEQVDTDVTKYAMEQMADSSIPSPLSGAVAADVAALSREESLLNRMRKQIKER
jgi:hypothetical protein